MTLPDAAAPPLEDSEALPALQTLIRAQLGLKAAPSQLQHGLRRAWPMLAARGIHDLPALVETLGRDERLWDELAPFLTVKETYFLREPQQLNDFVERFLPELRQRALRRGGRRLNVLSAGCATGEEAYTLAILLADAGTDATVWGIDLDRRALEVAEQGVYREHAFRGVPEDWRARHFARTGEGVWRVPPATRAQVRFRAGNLLQLVQKPPLFTFDAIFCRNVLIYFETAHQYAVLAGLRRWLELGGFLFLGHSELLRENQLGLARVVGARTTAYQRKEDL